MPGKRESRRYKGKAVVTQNDVEAGGIFPDTVAYAGWSMDDHFPAGFYHKDSYPTIFHPAPSPWGLPLRCMISANIENLVFAGRNISVTHAALSSSRVMATCSVLGQAIGTAVAMAVKDAVAVENIDVEKLQQTLLADDCFIPNLERKVSPLSLNAKCSDEILCNGKERGEDNVWIGDKAEYVMDKPTEIKAIRLVFDSDLNRKYHNMPCCYPLVETSYKLPETLIKEYKILAFDNEGNLLDSLHIKNNHQRFVVHKVDWKAKRIVFEPIATNGCSEFRLFSFEIM